MLQAKLWYIDEQLMQIVTYDGRTFRTPEANYSPNCLGKHSHVMEAEDPEEFNLMLIGLRTDHRRLMTIR